MGHIKRSLLIYVLCFTATICRCQNTDLEALKAKANSGDSAAAMQLGRIYDTGKGVRADRFEANDWYLKAAEAGNAEAQNIVGVNLRTGDGGRKDPQEALQWFRKAAKQGNADAMFNMATAFYNGEGVQIQDQLAVSWFIAAQAFGSKQAEDAIRRSADETKPIVQAAGILGGAQMLIKGQEVPMRVEAAIPWLTKLKDSGHKSADIVLAQLYLDGKVVPKNPDLAYEYCLDGAKSGLAQAMGCLGFIYRKGIGRPTDPHAAAEWYTKAASCGEPVSQFVLSEMYGNGEGVKADRAMQYVLLEYASQNLHELRNKAEVLKSQLTDQELKAAKKKSLKSSDKCSFDAGLL